MTLKGGSRADFWVFAGKRIMKTPPLLHNKLQEGKK